ncbi:MAG: HIT family protein [Anaerolineae bacterium]|jgi:diadenosine tetraphosphate (Ap4A) HIT family hydrolase
MSDQQAYERYEIDAEAYHRRCQTGPCFICRIVERDPEYPADIVYEDDVAIAFLDKYPRLYGWILVAPRAHREQVTGDFTIDEYLALQKRLYGVSEAVRQELGAERIYLLALGSNQGNAHVHWHIIPLPPGVPYREQQLAVFRQGILRIPEEERGALAARISSRIGEMGFI